MNQVIKRLKKIEDKFIQNGYFISEIENIKEFEKMDRDFYKVVQKISKIKSNFKLEDFHKHVNYSEINDLRVEIFREFNKSDVINRFYEFARDGIDHIVGNELAFQKQINLSIQMPNDKSSTLNMHSDSFNGESPFQVVLWIPLVDTNKTNSMFILSPKDNLSLIKEMRNYKDKQGIEKIYKKYQKKSKFLNLKKGQYLIFSSNLMHGNVINKEKTTRWSFNTRVKSLFSPYTSNEKNLGNFYKPLNIKPATLFGLNFETPE